MGRTPVRLDTTHRLDRARPMTAALLRATHSYDLPPAKGISPRTARAVLRIFARLANAHGDLKYGLRASKVATMAEVSLATAKRAEAHLVELGVLERVQVGGGRASTRWRVNVRALLGVVDQPDERAATPAAVSPPPSDGEPPQAPKHSRLFPRLSRPRAVALPMASGMSPRVDEVCPTHDSPGGVFADGVTPRCPSCRRLGLPAAVP